jgi:gliding motility-associated-like protein
MYNPPLRTDLPVDTAICLGERIRMHPEPYGGYGEYTISWNGLEIEELSVIPQRNETHRVTIEDECGSVLEHQVDVYVQEVDADFEFLYSDPFKSISNHSTSNCQYQWSFPDGSSSQEYEPIVADDILNQGMTSLFVINQLGCFDEVVKEFKPPFSVYLPTAFTPDGDGLNDVFKAETEYVESFELRIYDRWGNLVFESNDANTGWNGDTSGGRLTSGENLIYNYIYKAVSWSGDIKQGRGVVTLLR